MSLSVDIIFPRDVAVKTRSTLLKEPLSQDPTLKISTPDAKKYLPLFSSASSGLCNTMT